MGKRIQMSDATRNGVVLAIVALVVCAVGAVLVVGRGAGSTGPQAAAGTPRSGGFGTPCFGGGSGRFVPSPGTKEAHPTPVDRGREGRATEASSSFAPASRSTA